MLLVEGIQEGEAGSVPGKALDFPAFPLFHQRRCHRASIIVLTRI